MFVSPTERSLNASELAAPDRVGAVRLLKRIALGFAGVALAGGGALLPWTASTEVARELSASGLLALILASSLLGLAGLSATLWVAMARRDGTAPEEFQAPRRRSRFTPAERLARAARRPQGVIAPLFCAAAGLAIPSNVIPSSWRSTCGRAM